MDDLELLYQIRYNGWIPEEGFFDRLRRLGVQRWIDQKAELEDKFVRDRDKCLLLFVANLCVYGMIFSLIKMIYPSP